MTQFYITLPSNSSLDYYPNNTVANYITHLPRSIELNGLWEVAVVEVYYPWSFHTAGVNTPIHVKAYTEKSNNPTKAMIGIVSDNEKITPPLEAYTVTGSALSGSSDKVQAVVDSLNRDAELAKHVVVAYDPKTKRVNITSSDHVTKVVLDEKIALQLGFNPMKSDFKRNIKSVQSANLQLGLPSYIYIYCDIVEPQLIGDTSAPLLQILNVNINDYVFGAIKHVPFHSPHYVPVMKNNFENIEIDLRDDTGKPIPFQFGTSCVKLHFRKCPQ